MTHNPHTEDVLIEEAIRRHDEGEDVVTFLKLHPEIKKEVSALLDLQARISRVSKSVTPSDAPLRRALAQIPVLKTVSRRKRAVVSPWSWGRVVQIGLPVMALALLLIFFVERGIQPGVLPEAGTGIPTDSATSATAPQTFMKSSTMSLQANDSSVPPAATGRATDMRSSFQAAAAAQKENAAADDNDFDSVMTDDGTLAPLITAYENVF